MRLRLHYCVYIIEDFVVFACNIFTSTFCLYANNAFITKWLHS